MPKRFFLVLWVVLFLLLTILIVGVVADSAFMLATDLWFENLLLADRTPLFVHLFNWITLLGNKYVVLGITGIVGAALSFSRLYRTYAVGLVVAVIGAIGTNFILKAIMERARPSGFIPSIVETSSSFPSGHATFSLALYGFLTYFLCKHYPRYSTLLITTGSTIVLFVGFSRLYLGVHWLSDIIAGFALGGLWLLIGVEITKRLRNDTAAASLEITHPS